jgi:hypothetical protein
MRYYLFANDYFKDPVLGALPSTTGTKIRISRERRVRFIPNDDGLLPPFPADGTWQRSDGLFQFFQAMFE